MNVNANNIKFNYETTTNCKDFFRKKELWPNDSNSANYISITLQTIRNMHISISHLLVNQITPIPNPTQIRIKVFISQQQMDPVPRCHPHFPTPL